MVKERPILFKGRLVRRILAGGKTQTRRIVKLPPAPSIRGGWEPTTVGGSGVVDTFGKPVPEHAALWNQTTGKIIACPYGEPGDRLWVKETYAAKNTKGQIAAYRADGQSGAWAGDGGGGRFFLHHGWIVGEADPKRRGRWHGLGGEYGDKWRPSIHMPRKLSRLDLEIVTVRAERLLDITESDARAEGTEPFVHPAGAVSYRDGFANLWNDINGDTMPFDENPWVWRVEFKCVESP